METPTPSLSRSGRRRVTEAHAKRHQPAGVSCEHPLENWLSLPFCSDAENVPLESDALNDIWLPESVVSSERLFDPKVVLLLLLPLLPHWRLAPLEEVVPDTVKGMSVVPALVFTHSLPLPETELPFCCKSMKTSVSNESDEALKCPTPYHWPAYDTPLRLRSTKTPTRTRTTTTAAIAIPVIAARFDDGAGGIPGAPGKPGAIGWP